MLHCEDSMYQVQPETAGVGNSTSIAYMQAGDGTNVAEEYGGSEDGEPTFESGSDWKTGAAILNTGAYDFAGSGVVHMTVRG